jgi:hypothetical protein
MNRPTLIALLLSAAQALPSLAAAQVVQLNAGFMPDPRRASGMAGGMVQAQSVPGAPGNCRGFIPGAPQQIIQTPTGFNFLRVIAQPLAGTDLTLMVRGTSQTWCADDTYGNVPGLDLQALPPGRYDVYVGTYSQSGPAPFQLLMSELQSTVPDNNTAVRPQPQYPVRPQPQVEANALGALDFTGRPLFGRMMVAATSSPARCAAATAARSAPRASTARASAAASSRAPRTTWSSSRSRRAFLRMYVVSAADSTLVIRRPDGQVLCNDDTYSAQPRRRGGASPRGSTRSGSAPTARTSRAPTSSPSPSTPRSTRSPRRPPCAIVRDPRDVPIAAAPPPSPSSPSPRSHPAVVPAQPVVRPVHPRLFLVADGRRGISPADASSPAARPATPPTPAPAAPPRRRCPCPAPCPSATSSTRSSRSPPATCSIKSPPRSPVLREQIAQVGPFVDRGDPSGQYLTNARAVRQLAVAYDWLYAALTPGGPGQHPRGAPPQLRRVVGDPRARGRLLRRGLRPRRDGGPRGPRPAGRQHRARRGRAALPRLRRHPLEDPAPPGARLHRGLVARGPRLVHAGTVLRNAALMAAAWTTATEEDLFAHARTRGDVFGLRPSATSRTR